MKNNLERNIQSAFEHYMPELDNDAIWDNIEPHLEKKKKRRGIFFWFLLFSSFSLGFLFLQKENLFSSKKSVQSTDNQNITLNEASTKTLNSKEFCPEEKLLSKLPKSKTANNTKKVQTKNLLVENTLEAKQNLSVVKSDTPLNNLTQPLKLNEKNTSINEGGSASNEKVNSKQNATTNIELFKEMPPKEEKKEEPEERKKREPVKKKKRKRKKWQTHLQLTVAPVLPLKVLSNKSGSEFNNSLIEQRRATESFAGAFAANLNLQYIKKNGLILHTGIEYLQIDERFYEKSTSVVSETVTGPVIIVENAAGNITETVEGDKIVTTTTNKEFKLYNNHRFVSIPFGIGTSWKYRKNHYKVYGGLQYNLYYSFNGTFYSRPQARVNFSRRESFIYDQVFRKNAGLGLWLAAEYSRPINKKMSWIISPKIQAPLTSLTQERYDINQRYFTFNLNLGLSWLLE